MPKLTQLVGPKTLAPIELTEKLVMVGRTTDNTVCLEDWSVSKHHALFVNEEGCYRLIDLHATNGTFVNAQRIESAELHHGDQVQIGAFAFGYEHEVEAADMAAAATPPPTAIPVSSLTSVPPAVAKGVGVPKMEKTVISEGPHQKVMRLRREEPPAETPPPVARVVSEPEPAKPAEDVPLVKPHPTPTSHVAGKGRHFIRLPTDRSAEPPAKESGLVKKLISREKPVEPAAPAPEPAPAPEQPTPAKPKIMRFTRGPGAPPLPPRPIQKLAAAAPPPVEPPPPAPEPPLAVAALVEPPPPPPLAPTPEPEPPSAAAAPAEPEPAPPVLPPVEPPTSEPPSAAAPEQPLVTPGAKETPEEIATKPAPPEGERELRLKPKPQAEDRPLMRGPSKGGGGGDQLIIKKPDTPKE